jgi:hypothetical protein
LVKSVKALLSATRCGYRRKLACAAGLLALLAVPGTEAAAAPLPSSLVNTIETWRWSPPSPDPSGLGYDSASNRLLVADGEVDEMSIYAGANYYESTLGGSLLRTTNTLAFSREAVGVAFAPGRVFIADDDQRRIFDATLGADGRFDPGDPVTSFATTALGINDPEGVSYDRTGNRLFVAGGEFSQVFEVAPVDGVFGNGNDQVRQFATAPIGVNDPEAVEFNPESGTLFMVTANGDKIVEATTSGALVSEIDTSYLPLDKPAGLVYAPRSTDPSKKSFYIADRKVDNDGHPDENDGAIYEVAVGQAPPPPPPPPPPSGVRVAAGSDDAEEAASGSVSLTSSDLELVTDGSVVQTVGLRFAGLAIPAGADITNAYIQFTADEAQSVATNLTIAAQAADNAPTFTTALRNVSSRVRTGASVAWSPAAWTAGQAGTSQRTPDLQDVIQQVVNRPGWASGNAMAFIIDGSGHRTADAFEGGAANAPLLHVEFQPPSGGNEAPRVDAGPDQTISLPAGATLDAAVSDDGQPNPTPSTAWSKVSGPGTVTFANGGAVDTQATFSAAGTYVLRLTANDGALTTSDEVTIIVNPAGPPTVERRVAAGSDDAEEAASGSVSLTSSDLELVTDGSVVQTVGLRFAGLAIPAGATITNAYIQFTADEAQSVATNLTIAAQAADNAPTFTTAAFNVSSRPRTTASVGWSPAAWTAGQAGANQRTPNLAAVIQQVVNGPGWASGNAMAFIINGSGHRTADAFEGGAANAPLLHIEYQ